MRKFLALVASRLLLIAFAAASLCGQASVRRVQILGNKDNVEIEVEATDRIVPQTQVLTGPDRLVIDIPNATPGGQLRSQSIDRGQVKDVRVGLFQSRPPVTRLVLDLKSAQNYQVFPDGRKVIVKVTGSAPETAAANPAALNPAALNPALNPNDPRLPRIVDDPDEPTRPGLVATNYTASKEPAHVDPPAAKPPLEVSFRGGLLAIHSNKATLSEILTAVQQQTGAQVSGATGGEQEQVVVDLGPAPAAEVLARLLYGSKFNFLILSASSDPDQLDRVILTPRADIGSMPQPLPQMQAADEPQMGDPEPPPPEQPVEPQPIQASNPPQRLPRADAVPVRQGTADPQPPPADDPQE
jgi:AMIN domain